MAARGGGSGHARERRCYARGRRWHGHRGIGVVGVVRQWGGGGGRWVEIGAVRGRLLRESADVVGGKGGAGQPMGYGRNGAGRRWVAVRGVAECRGRRALRTGVGGKRDLPRPSGHAREGRSRATDGARLG